jgi:hypothetical protein
MDQNRKNSFEDPSSGSASGFKVNISGLSFLEFGVGPLNQQLIYELIKKTMLNEGNQRHNFILYL